MFIYKADDDDDDWFSAAGRRQEHNQRRLEARAELEVIQRREDKGRRTRTEIILEFTKNTF